MENFFFQHSIVTKTKKHVLSDSFWKRKKYWISVRNMLTVSFIGLGILLIFVPDGRRMYYSIFDQLKTSLKYSVSVPSFLIVNFFAVVLALPLFPFHLYSSYCLGSVFGFSVNVLGSLLGAFCIIGLLRFVPHCLPFVAERQKKTTGTMYNFFEATFSLTITFGITVYKNVIDMVSFFYSILMLLFISFVYSMFGSRIDNFILFFEGKSNDIHSIIVLTSVLIVWSTNYSLLIWYSMPNQIHLPKWFWNKCLCILSPSTNEENSNNNVEIEMETL